MGLCKGNRGNLMQHWTLCECLGRLHDLYGSLHFVTTHSMAPWAIPVVKPDPDHCRNKFIAAGSRLAALDRSSRYEAAWKQLSITNGLPYPSSAVLACETWKKPLTLALCEYDPNVASEIDGWLSMPQTEDRLQPSPVLRGDWRCLVCSPLVLNTSQQCIFVEMDPMRYDSRRKRSNVDPNGRKNCDPQSLYPEDIERLVTLLTDIETPIVLQISSFSTQNANSLSRQRDSLSGILNLAGFNLRYETTVGDQMASFVFHRNSALPPADFRAEFSDWLGGIE